MDRRDKFKKLVLTIGLTAGIFVGLLGFVAKYNKAQESGGAIGVGIFFGLLYFGAVFGGILLVYKIIEWAALGFYKDEKKAEIAKEALNIRGGVRKVVIVLAAIAALWCGISVGLFPLGQYRSAKKDLEVLESRKKDYEGKAYYDYMQFERLQDNYWLNLRKGGLVGLCILGALFGTIFSFLAIWFVYKFLERFILNLCGVREE